MAHCSASLNLFELNSIILTVFSRTELLTFVVPPVQGMERYLEGLLTGIPPVFLDAPSQSLCGFFLIFLTSN